MSDDNGQRAPLHWQDAFTSPSWQIPELDEAVLAPPLEDFGLTDFRAPRDLPKPPDVDEILRGEYTGWVPVIREGESLAQAQEREQALVAPTVIEETVQVVEVVQQPAVVEQGQATQPPVSQSPWLAVETFEYGLQAHHEVPKQPQSTPVAYVEPIQEVPRVQPAVVTQVAESAPVVDATFETPVREDPAFVTAPAPQPPASAVQSDTFNDTFDTSTWSSSDSGTSQSAPQQPQSIDATFVTEPAAQADQSLELVIMRDEIQDLRTRLDASQKLVEEMMHKLANLAELALRSRM
jgi:hypothetical protein